MNCLSKVQTKATSKNFHTMSSKSISKMLVVMHIKMLLVLHILKRFLNPITDTQGWIENSSATVHIRGNILWWFSCKCTTLVGKPSFSDQLKYIKSNSKS